MNGTQFRNNGFIPVLLLLIGISLIAVASPVIAQSTYYVNDGDTTGDRFTNSAGDDSWTDAEAENDPDSPFRSINRALRAIAPGDTIAIDSGVFSDDVSMDTDNITVRGASADTTVINGRISKIGGSGLQIKDLQIISSGAGISLSDFDTPIISNVIIDNANNEAIRLSNVSNALVENAVGTGAGNEGLALTNVTGSTITQNTFGNNGRAGISLEGSSNNQFLNNVTKNNGAGFSGVEITNNSDNNLFRDNKIHSNDSHGLEETGSTGNSYRSNQVFANNDNGIVISNSSHPSLRFNLIRSNSKNGFEINNTGNVKLFLNELSKNTEYQILFGSSVTLEEQSKNNVVPSATNGDSLVLNESSNSLTMERNWWNTTDTSAINSGIRNTGGGNIDYIPFRLAPVDTAPGADTVAPETPDNFNADTSIPNEVRLSWDVPDGSEEPDMESSFQVNGIRLYRSSDSTVTDWKSQQLVELNASDSSFIDSTVKTDSTYFYRITAYDSVASYENESFYSTIFKVKVPSIGPGIYVNDGSTSGDIFTTDVGNDSNVGIPQSPVRTVSKALELAGNGDTIFVDTGHYADTLTVDTPNLTIIGAGQSKTQLTGSSPSISGHGLNLTGNAGSLHLRSLTVRDFDRDGINIDGAGDVRFENLTLKNNSDNGIDFNNGASNGYVAQTTFDENASEQIRFNGGGGHEVNYNNIVTPASSPDSGIIDNTGNDVTRNWWTTPDSNAIAAQINGSSQYIPHRLGIVDTGVGADSIAPATPSNVRVDTTVPRELTVKWNEVTTNENGTPNSDLHRYRVFRIDGVGDTPDWTQHLVQTLPPGDTSYTDKNVVKTQPYTYRVTSVDNSTPENSSYFSSVESGTWFNRVPDADTAVVSTTVDSAVDVTLSGTDVDGDPLTYSISDPPDSGTITSPSDTQSMAGPDPTVTYTPDSGVTGVDRFKFKITDGLDTSAGSTVTVDIATVLKINVSRITTTAVDTPAIADGTDTVGINVTFRNTGTGDGIVLRDTDQLKIRNSFDRDVTDSFLVTMAETDVLVPAGSSRTTKWIIHTSTTPTGFNDTRTELLGNFRSNLDPELVSLEDAVSKEIQDFPNTEQNRQSRVFNITSPPRVYSSGGEPYNLDEIERFEQSIIFNGGRTNGTSMFDLNPPSASDGDSVFILTQRGHVNPNQNINTLDTPLLDPGLGINTETQFTNAVSDADQLLENNTSAGTLDFVDTGLLSISIWLRQVNAEYIGDDLDESVDITVRNVTLPDGVSDPDRLEVVKLIDDGGQWKWQTVDELSESSSTNFNGSTGRVTFTVPESVGFSVFRIVSSGFSTSGEAGDAVVYPNPFVPEDGNPETGEYGLGNRQGIHFGAGQDRGFPSGTTVKIYTIRGQQVDKITTNVGGIIRWDAHTDNGDPAASGVYIYRIETPNGDDKVGKFAIVR